MLDDGDWGRDCGSAEGTERFLMRRPLFLLWTEKTLQMCDWWYESGYESRYGCGSKYECM